MNFQTHGVVSKHCSGFFETESILQLQNSYEDPKKNIFVRNTVKEGNRHLILDKIVRAELGK